MRIGVLGGTFDPVHLGHLVIAEEARVRLGLEEVCFVPAGEPWMKAGNLLSPALDRLDMVRMGVEDNPFFRVSTVEVDRAGPSYTVDTLESLQEDYGPEARFYFIMGADAFARFGEWKNPEGVLQRATLVVVDRPEEDGIEAMAAAESPALPAGMDGNVERIRGVRLQISASDIRLRVQEGLSIRYLVPSPVEQRIYARGLYRQ